MKRLLFLLALILAPSLAWGQIAPLTIGGNPIIGGTTGQALITGADGRLSQVAIPAATVTSFSAGSTGFTPSTATTGAVTLAGVLVGANGGTGVANTGKTITLGGSLTTSGAFDTTLTVTGATGVTLPTSGTLAILGANTFTGAQTFINGAVGAPALVSGRQTTDGIYFPAAGRMAFTLNGVISATWDTSGNVGGGPTAVQAPTTGVGNVGFSTRALRLVAGGNDNFAANTDALRTASSGSNNFAANNSAGFAVTTASNVLLIGQNAGATATDYSGIIALGKNAGGFALTNVGAAVATLPSIYIGEGAGRYTQNITAEGENVCVGPFTCGYANGSTTNMTGYRTVAVGPEAGYSNNQGVHNTYIGAQAGRLNQSGGSNTNIGRSSDGNNVTGGFRTTVGHAACYWSGSGDSDTCIGNGTGTLDISGAKYTGGVNAHLGESSGRWGLTNTRTLTLGPYAQVSGDNLTVVGNGQTAAYVSGNLSSRLTPTALNNAAGVTWTAAQMRGRLINRSGAAAVADTTATAANIVASLPGVQKNALASGAVQNETNAGYELAVRNDNSDVLTITPNASGVTGVGTMTIAAAATGLFWVFCPTVTAASEACTIQRIN